MTINECNFVLHDQDLNRLIHRFVPATKKLNSLQAELQAGRLILSGRANVFLNINFQATLLLSHTDTEIIVHLDRINPMSGLLAQFKDKILQKIAARSSFIRHDASNDSLRIQLNEVFGPAVKSANLTIIKLTVEKNDLTLAVAGKVAF